MMSKNSTGFSRGSIKDNGIYAGGAFKRKCVKVLDGKSFLVDKPIKGRQLITLYGVKKGNKKRLEKLVKGKVVTICPVGVVVGTRKG